MGRNGSFTTYLSVGLIAVGFLLMFLAWHYSANLDYVQGQFPYLLSATAPGLGLVMTGLTLAVVQELRRSSSMIVSHLRELPSAEGPLSEPVAAPVDGEHVVATATTFHDPECAVVAGRTDLTHLAASDAVERGLVACRVCEPQADAA